MTYDNEAIVREAYRTAEGSVLDIPGFVGSIADHVTVLHQGSVLAEGSLEQVQSDERVVEVYLGR